MVPPAMTAYSSLRYTQASAESRLLVHDPEYCCAMGPIPSIPSSQLPATSPNLPLEPAPSTPPPTTSCRHWSPAQTSLDMDTETMRTSVSGERVTFLFSTEAGEKQQRERFEWTRLKKGEDHEAKSDGFRLVQVSKRSGRPRTSSEAASESVNGGSPSFLAAVENHESLAPLSWSSGLSKMTHPFLLRLQTSTSSMGNRWALMVVITALRLWEMNVQGRTSKVGVLAEGKTRED
ncbi:hypothetical protein CGCVW01_v010692 [Colletotrichum viniferum]|nr:hypothetical protein CGCVW01_v010692 [Colletotrichum viniferum]